MSNPYDLRAKYTRFRILVIGRANAGKTTLLQRVCNTTEDPCIYDDNNKNLLEPTSARGIHDIDRPFAFKSNPGFIFHDSPGFESGDERQLQKVLSFIKKKARSREVDDQLHAIWFCFVLYNARPLLPLETAFFETARAGKVPVIAIFTKFDDLITQIYDINQDDDVNRKNAEEQVEIKFREPLYKYAFPPRADVCFEDLHNETGNHQDQVKVLIEKTASSLDNTALSMLFVSVQQSNIDLCVQYAINFLVGSVQNYRTKELIIHTLMWFGHSYLRGYNYDRDDGLLLRGDGRLGLGGHRRLLGSLLLGDAIKNDLEPFICSYFNINGIQILGTRLGLLMFTALLICTENTFWDKQKPGNGEFVEFFKKSFTLYVESRMMEMVETDIDMLRNEQGVFLVNEDFKGNFYKFIVDHYLPIPGHSRAQTSGESVSGESRVSEEQATDSGGEKKVSWLRNLMLKFRRRQTA